MSKYIHSESERGNRKRKTTTERAQLRPRIQTPFPIAPIQLLVIMICKVINCPNKAT